MEQPRTQYTAARDPAIAFQVADDEGSVDVVLVGPPLTHLEIAWSEPSLARAYTRLAGLGRAVIYDRRAAGLSDPSPGPYTLADEVDDLLAVMDAAGVQRAAVISWVAGGPVACLLAATHPDRVRSLVLDTCVARQAWAEDYPWAPTPEERAAVARAAAGTWGDGNLIARFAPDWASDPAARLWMGRAERMGVSPGVMRRLNEHMNQTDVRAVLPSIRAPTLVVRRRDDVQIDRRHSVYVAERIVGARLVELDGGDSLPFGPGLDAWVDLVGQFVAGARPPVPATRALAALLFTDIVDSTATVARIGDARWRELLGQHDLVVRRAVVGSGGHLVKSLGDGAFARFESVPAALAAATTVLESTSSLGIRVRAGVHLGDCELVGDDLAGRTVHEAARIAALAGPGEILISDAARGLLAGAGVVLRDCGTHALKGFDGRYRLWSVPSATGA